MQDDFAKEIGEGDWRDWCERHSHKRIVQGCWNWQNVSWTVSSTIKISCKKNLTYFYYKKKSTHFSLSRDISKITLDREKKIDDINVAILNTYGTRPVYNPPCVVFEKLVKDKIDRLEEPMLNCIDSVKKGLISTIQICTQHVSDAFVKFLFFL